MRGRLARPASRDYRAGAVRSSAQHLRLLGPPDLQQCAQPQQCTLLLSEPLPPSPQAYDLALAKAQQGVSALSFRRQVNLFSTAAASGSQANLELVWAVVRPRVCPELLHVGPNKLVPRYKQLDRISDPGVTAAAAGHPHLLPWLLAHCPGLVDPAKTLAAVAGHCDLAALQGAWDLLREAITAPGAGEDSHQPGRIAQDSGSGAEGPSMWEQVLDAAAGCKLPDGRAKLEWVIAAGGGCGLVRAGTVAAAVRSGQLDRVRWLLQEFPWVRVGPMKGCIVAAALQHCDLGVAEWLVDEAGCALPSAEQGSGAAAYSGSVAKLQWLEGRGLPLAWDPAAHCAAVKGHLGVLRFLWERSGDSTDASLQLDEHLLYPAVASGSIGTAAWLLQHGCPLAPTMYAAASGDVDMVRWLLNEVRPDISPGKALMDLVCLWPDATSADDAGLAAAVALVLEAAMAGGGGAVAAGKATALQIHRAANDAARRGNVAVLRAILEHPLAGGRPTDGAYLRQSASSGSVDTMLWVCAAEVPTAQLRRSLRIGCIAGLFCHEALVRGDLATAAHLTSMGREWSGVPLAQVAEDGGFLSALQWMVQWGAAAGPAEVLQALEVARRAEVREWLLSLLPQGPVRKEAVRFLMTPFATVRRLIRRNTF